MTTTETPGPFHLSPEAAARVESGVRDLLSHARADDAAIPLEHPHPAEHAAVGSAASAAVVSWRDYPAMETDSEPAPKPRPKPKPPAPRVKRTTVKRDEKGLIIETLTTEEEIQ